jgi:tetratricopeptide (TPR) repeat protein
MTDRPRGGAPRRRNSPSGPQRGPARGERRDRGGPRSTKPAPVERDSSRDLEWPEEIFELELEPDVMKELEAFGSRPGTLARHLLSVQVLAEADPQAAYQHAARVRERIPRSALARQTACIAAYRVGRFKEALKEESAYRRISGNLDLLAIAADCERGLGRPTRALALVAEFEKQKMDADARTELYIVGGGARRDLGDMDAARVLLQKAVRAARTPMAVARAHYALGDLMADLGDVDQARTLLQSAVDVDEGGAWTDAAGRLGELG